MPSRSVRERARALDAAASCQQQRSSQSQAELGAEAEPSNWLACPEAAQLTDLQVAISRGGDRDKPPPLIQALLADDGAALAKVLAQAAQDVGFAFGDGGILKQLPEEYDGVVNGQWVHSKLARAAAVHEVRAGQRQCWQRAGVAGGPSETANSSLIFIEGFAEVESKLELNPGTTLLVAAARLAAPAVTSVLLRHGADPSIFDGAGHSPLKAARRGGMHYTSVPAAEVAERRKAVTSTLRQHSAQRLRAQRRQQAQRWRKDHPLRSAQVGRRERPEAAEAAQGVVAKRSKKV